MTPFTQIKTETVDPDEPQIKAGSSIIERFFKVMARDFHTMLRLPPAFCKKLNGETPDDAVLTSRRGKWHVKIGGRMNGKVCLADGWGKFAESHGLEIGNFVVFEYQGDMHFNVSVYDSSTCEKEFPSDVKEEDDEDDTAESRRKTYERANRQIKRGRPRKISGCSQESRQFFAKIRADHLSSYGLPLTKTFWKSNRLEGTTKVLLTGPSGESFKVKLKWHTVESPCFGRGWLDFCKSNHLKEEDICLFKLTDEPPISTLRIKINVQVFSAPG